MLVYGINENCIILLSLKTEQLAVLDEPKQILLDYFIMLTKSITKFIFLTLSGLNKSMFGHILIKNEGNQTFFVDCKYIFDSCTINLKIYIFTSGNKSMFIYGHISTVAKSNVSLINGS